MNDDFKSNRKREFGHHCEVCDKHYMHYIFEMREYFQTEIDNLKRSLNSISHYISLLTPTPVDESVKQSESTDFNTICLSDNLWSQTMFLDNRVTIVKNKYYYFDKF